MAFDVRSFILNYDEVPLEDIVVDKNGRETERRPATFRLAWIEALNRPTPEALTGSQKAERFALSVKISSSDKPELTAGELALIQECVGATLPPVVVGRTNEAIDALLLEQPGPKPRRSGSRSRT